ncbi:MAG: GNAT family N-acetyltransferase [Sulfobacillus sp.]
MQANGWTMKQVQDRNPYWDLMILAEEPPALLRYWQQGTLWSFAHRDSCRAVALMMDYVRDPQSIIELKLLAVGAKWRGQGIGRHFIQELALRYSALGYVQMVVGTANCSVGNLAFYQKAGMRMRWIEADYFVADHGYSEPIVENGIEGRDKVWFDMRLTPKGRD